MHRVLVKYKPLNVNLCCDSLPVSLSLAECYISSLRFGTRLLQYGRGQKQEFLLLFSLYHLLFFLWVLFPIFNIWFWFTVIDSRIGERQKEESSGRLLTNNIFQNSQSQSVLCGPLVVCQLPVWHLQTACWALVPNVTSWTFDNVAWWSNGNVHSWLLFAIQNILEAVFKVPL